MRIKVKEFFIPQFSNVIERNAFIQSFLKIYLPALIEFALIQFVNMFDQMQVGNCGQAAIAAVGVSNQIKQVVSIAFLAVNVGITSFVARLYGEGKKQEIIMILRNGLIVSLGFSLLVACFGYGGASSLLSLLKVPDSETMALGVSYFRICMFGIVPVALTATITATFRGVGKTRIPMLYNLVANIVNVILNWVLINGIWFFPKMGVRGAAIATITAQIIALLLAITYVFRKDSHLEFDYKVFFSKEKIGFVKNILKIGFPIMIEQAVAKVGMIRYTSLVTALGTSLYATHVICMNIQLLTGMNGQSFSTVSTVMTGQCLGKKDDKMAIKYTFFSTKLCLLVSFVLMLVYCLCGAPLIRLYNDDYQIVNTGIDLLRIVAIMQPFTAFQYVFAGAMRGAGDTKRVSMCYIFAQLICRPSFAYLFINVLNWGISGAWWALVVSESICSVLLILFYLSGKWKGIKIY